MVEIITGFALGYGVPMYLVKRYVARHRGDGSARQRSVVDRAA